jgi:hypothetical protein
MKIVFAALLPLTLACTTLPAEGGPDEGEGHSNGPCAVVRLGDLVGRAATRELGAEALRRSGARTLRWIRPGDVVTMDYSEDRLNIRLDARNRVEGFSCG